jgi:hypothetical protein
MITPRDEWGPFDPRIEAAERMARARAFRVAIHVHCGAAGRETVELLRQAERDPAALPQALAAFDRLPALTQRRILSSYSAAANENRARRTSPQAPAESRTKSSRKPDRREAQGRLESLFTDLVSDPGPEGINAFCRHARIELSTEGKDAADRWWPTFLANYLTGAGTVDEERVASDLATFPPIAARIAELRRERH